MGIYIRVAPPMPFPLKKRSYYTVSYPGRWHIGGGPSETQSSTSTTPSSQVTSLTSSTTSTTSRCPCGAIFARIPCLIKGYTTCSPGRTHWTARFQVFIVTSWGHLNDINKNRRNFIPSHLWNKYRGLPFHWQKPRHQTLSEYTAPWLSHDDSKMAVQHHITKPIKKKTHKKHLELTS